MSNKRYLTFLKKISPVAILLLTFFLQMQYLAELRQQFPNGFAQPFCGVDAQAHLHRSLGLLAGTIPGQEPFYFIPLYPLYLAGLQVIGGNSILLPIFLQALYQLAGIAALYRIGTLTFSRLTGILAALGLATYSYYLFYLPCFDQTLLTVPSLTLSIFFLLRYSRHHQPRHLLAAGITLALAALSRPTILVIYPAVMIWLLIESKSQRSDTPANWRSFLWSLTQRGLLLIVPFIIIVAPITWHNYQATGRFILISDNAGVNLFTGNNPDAYGLDSLAHVQSQPAVIRFKELAPRVEQGETTYAREVWAYITQQPADWLELAGRKTWLWLAAADKPLVSPFFPLTVNQSRALDWLPLEWQAASIAALLGIVFSFMHARSRQKLYLLWLVYAALSAATIIFFIQLRFRLPYAPFVMLSAASFVTAAPHLHSRYPQIFWITVIGLLLLFPLVPGLWLFVLPFLALGLRSPQVKLMPAKRFIIMGMASIYVLVWGLWLSANRQITTAQTIDNYLGPPLAANGILGQTFEMGCDNLDQIEITLGVFNNQHDQSVTFFLATDTSAQEILFSETFSGDSVEDYQRKRFSFNPIPNSAGETFFFYLSSPAATPQNAITFRGYSSIPVDHYPAGQALAGDPNNLQQIEGDFAFTASCQASWLQRLRIGMAEFFGQTQTP